MRPRPRRALAPVLVLAAVAGPLPAGGASAPTADPADESDEALLERVLDRAQASLEERLVLIGDHARWETAWEIETRDYQVRTSLNWYIGRKLGEDLETMLGFFRELGRTQWRPPEPMNVFLFPTLAEYNAFGDEHGQEHSSMLGSFWASDQADRPVALYFDSNRRLLSIWATHSAFHQFSGQAFSSTPELWLDEGLASYFAIFHWDAEWGATEFRRVVDTGRFIPLRQLMRDPIAAWVDDPDARFFQLGALFTYLLNYREDTRTQRNAEGVVLLSPAADYVADLLRGRDVSDHPVHELFTTRLDELEADLRAFQFDAR